MPHPIVAQMDPSKEQWPAILAQDRDVVVTAGAGTGKTRTLVARYLSLLADGLALRSIVAITFTKKAAREMRNRVRQELRRYLERTDLAEGERRRWLDLYGELDAARIGTIHNLCSEILRAHPAEARIDPRFDVLAEGQATILLHQALDEALSWAADQAEIVPLFALLGERGLRDSLETLLRRRLDAKKTFTNLPADPLDHWQQALARRQASALTALQGNPAWGPALHSLRSNAATQPDDRIELQRQNALDAIDAAVGPLPEQLDSLSRLATINLTGGRAAAWPGAKEQRDEVKDALRTLRGLYNMHEDPLALRLTPLDEALAQALSPMRALFDRALHRYNALKQERHLLDFDDLEQGALTLLRQDPTVCARWQEEAQAILVDEFQDTNDRQRSLVKLLNGTRGRLFIVGDGKQSIYLFRGADVSVFRQERERIEGEGGAAFSLDTSYRGHRDLIQGLNDLLQPILGDEDPDRPWVEPFAPLKHHRGDPNPGFKRPYIELHLALGKKKEGALSRAAEALVKRILELQESGAVQHYEDVAILCRASTSFAAYEDALDRAGLPFLTVAGRGFYRRPEIRDLLNALQALADPTDDLALAGLLRSPVLALSDAALYHLCQARGRGDKAVPLWDVLRKPPPAALSPQDRARAIRAADLVARLHRQAGRVPVADLLKSFLDETDYRAALILRHSKSRGGGQSRAARNVSKLLADAHASGIVGVGEFLEYVKELRDSGAREGEARATAEGAVQIMTIHQAKGLEFPVVVIGDVNSGSRQRNPLLIDPELGILLPHKDEQDQRSASYSLGKRHAQDKEAAESDRLLYVAATRAREKLILSGNLALNRDNRPTWLGEWFKKISGDDVLGLARIQIAYDEEGAGSHRYPLPEGQVDVACTLYEPKWHWEPPAQPEEKLAEHPLQMPPPLLAPVDAGAIQLDRQAKEQERVPPQRAWRVVPAVARPRAPAWVIGSLVHAALAAWRFPQGEFDRWAEARARGYGLTDPRQLEDAVRRSAQLLRRFQAHPLFRDMAGAERRLHEVPYDVEHPDGRIERGVIDALYLREGVWTIVEFKTDRVRDRAAFDQLLEREDYVAQAQRYLNAAERLLGSRPKFVLCMLSFGNDVRLVREFG